VGAIHLLRYPRRVGAVPGLCSREWRLRDRRQTAAAIYGLYTAGTYLTALPGGWIADRLIGARSAVIIGGLFITLGNVLLAISESASGFYIGLFVIVLGVGLLKPNVSAMVAELYPEGGARRDSGLRFSTWESTSARLWAR